MTPEEELSLKRGRFTYENEQAQKRASAATEKDPAPETEAPAKASFPKGRQAVGG